MSVNGTLPPVAPLLPPLPYRKDGGANRAFALAVVCAYSPGLTEAEVVAVIAPLRELRKLCKL